MGNRKTPLITGEYYHVYLRGVEKRDIVLDSEDIDRFLLSLTTFNTTEPVGSIYEHSFRKENQLGSLTSKLVEIIAFNILQNHYHLLLRQSVDGGISKFMQSFNGGYTKYFNHRYKRAGVLFQGTFGSAHIKTDAHLRYTAAYVNLNHMIHKLGSLTSKWGKRSSWEQYTEGKERTYAVVCDTESILELYRNKEKCISDLGDIACMIATEREREKMEDEENEVLKQYLEV